MKYSKLKHELELLELTHKHEAQLMEMRQSDERSYLLNKCTHKYEDGTPSREFKGNQFDSFYSCGICGVEI